MRGRYGYNGEYFSGAELAEMDREAKAEREADAAEAALNYHRPDRDQREEPF